LFDGTNFEGEKMAAKNALDRIRVRLERYVKSIPLLNSNSALEICGRGGFLFHCAADMGLMQTVIAVKNIQRL